LRLAGTDGFAQLSGERFAGLHPFSQRRQFNVRTMNQLTQPGLYTLQFLPIDSVVLNGFLEHPRRLFRLLRLLASTIHIFQEAAFVG
jgi:hypothetical protein